MPAHREARSRQNAAGCCACTSTAKPPDIPQTSATASSANNCERDAYQEAGTLGLPPHDPRRTVATAPDAASLSAPHWLELASRDSEIVLAPGLGARVCGAWRRSRSHSHRRRLEAWLARAQPRH